MRGNFATADRWNRYYDEQAARYAAMAKKIIDREQESVAAAPDGSWSTFWDWTRAEDSRAAVFRAISHYSHGARHFDALHRYWADVRKSLLAKKGGE